VVLLIYLGDRMNGCLGAGGGIYAPVIIIGFGDFLEVEAVIEPSFRYLS